MDMIAAGFWGAFFGSAALSLTGATLAFTRSARRVALTGSLSAVLSAAYALLFLGWVPVDNRETLQRLQALTAISSAAVLAVLLFLLLGTFRRREMLVRAEGTIAAAAIVACAVAWFAHPQAALEIGMGVAALVAIGTIMASAASARRGERAGWLALAALLFLSVGMLGVDWYALNPQDTPWQLHALSAVAGMAFLVCIATAMWSRYAYLIEVSQVMTQGRNFDPVTRMPAYEAGQAVAEVFPEFEGKPCAIIVVSIANIKMVEELHGRAAYNHALFVCASRLRRMALAGVEYVHLREDSFVLLFRHPPEVEQLIDRARQVVERLTRPVTIATSRDIGALEASSRKWEAQVGVGLAIEPESVQLDLAIAGARAMSRTAWNYASRIAWYDEASQEISELPDAG
ncbi:MAG TPA: GGDEF domain-containing protein [Ramlibacter sp.]|nr:GGDEF domain-containing protein [Ramlibacter sp.]